VSRGIDRERKIRKALKDAGWVAIRASMGEIDVVACKPVSVRHDITLSEVRFIQVKSTAQSPYERFGPSDRKELSDLARAAGATAWLIWWPPRKGWRWIEEGQWPRAK